LASFDQHNQTVDFRIAATTTIVLASATVESKAITTKAQKKDHTPIQLTPDLLVAQITTIVLGVHLATFGFRIVKYFAKGS
jgi:hypothetical protein